ncbi:MAG: hypothetical protein Q8M94_08950, partial [Ignavibacteria bacterium]|nr:hypothetical protein [Ignavibacteria bacterium]
GTAVNVTCHLSLYFRAALVLSSIWTNLPLIKKTTAEQGKTMMIFGKTTGQSNRPIIFNFTLTPVIPDPSYSL